MILTSQAQAQRGEDTFSKAAQKVKGSAGLDLNSKPRCFFSGQYPETRGPLSGQPWQAMSEWKVCPPPPSTPCRLWSPQVGQ